jgi:hypothetical protein
MVTIQEKLTYFLNLHHSHFFIHNLIFPLITPHYIDRIQIQVFTLHCFKTSLLAYIITIIPQFTIAYPLDLSNTLQSHQIYYSLSYYQHVEYSMFSRSLLFVCETI